MLLKKGVREKREKKREKREVKEVDKKNPYIKAHLSRAPGVYSIQGGGGLMESQGDPFTCAMTPMLLCVYPLYL